MIYKIYKTYKIYKIYKINKLYLITCSIQPGRAHQFSPEGIKSATHSEQYIVWENLDNPA